MPTTETVCTVDGCENPRLARGLCSKHWQRARRYGDPSVTLRNRDRGYTVDSNGYRVVFAANHPNADAHGRIYQHRLVMSEMLGRPLLPTESVHHRNGDRGDNRPENLELWVKYQPIGGRVEDVLAWADEILERYGPLIDEAEN